MMEKSAKEVIVFGEYRCHKARFYSDELTKRGVSHRFVDVSQDKQGAEQLRSLYTDNKIKFPTLLIHGKRLRNPHLDELDKVLARESLIDLGVLYQPHANRFVQYKLPQDWMMSFSLSQERLVFTHLSVPEELSEKQKFTFVSDVLTKATSLGLSFSINNGSIKKIIESQPR